MATKKNVEKVEVEQKDIDEIKIEIIDYAEKRIDLEVEQAVKRAEKRLINQKNYAIIKRNIIIVLLLILSVYLTYLLHNTGYFNKYLNKPEKQEVQEQSPQNSTEITPEEKSETDILIEKYSYLLNNIEINENSNYLKDYYNGNLTNELKLYLAANQLEENEIISEESTNIIENEKIENAYKKLFNDKKYENISFEYKNLKFKYLKTQDIYIADGTLETTKSNIVRVINSIEKTQDKIEILTTEALVEKNKMSNIETKKEISTYKDSSSLKNNKEKLNNMKYTFICEEEACYLNSIESIK